MPPLPRLTFVSPLIRAALTRLEATLPGQISAFNAEAENLVDLAVPVAYVFGAADPIGAAGYPFVEVAVASGRGADPGFGLGQPGSVFDHFPALSVVAWNEGDKGEVSQLYETSVGYVRCLLECLLPVDALGDQGAASSRGGAPLFSWRVGVPEDLARRDRELEKWQMAALVQIGIDSGEEFGA